VVDIPHAGQPRVCSRAPELAFLDAPLQNGISTRFPAAVEWREFMGLAMSPFQLLIILLIVALIFGTKRLKDIGGDLGSAVKSFRKAMNTTGEIDDTPADPPKQLSRDEEKQKQ
jgi:sec-independent protein translocase protein TatA